MQGDKKTGVCKKALIGHTFFKAKATDLKTIFFKALEKWVYKHVSHLLFV